MDGSLGSASGEIRLDASGAISALNQVGAGLKNLDAQSGKFGAGLSGAISRNEQHLNTLGTGLTAIGVGFLGAFGFGVKGASDFQSAMSELSVATGATGDDLDRLRELALQLGKDTNFSATEAAAAITELGKAGLSTEQIYNGAADAVVNLATAGELDLASAATVLTNAMNQYGLSAEDAVMVTDTLARGAAASTADVRGLAEGLTYVGTTANQLGIPITDTTAALAALNDQGIQGSMAGTSLNAALTSLINPSAKAAGAMSDLGLSAGGAFSVIDESTGTMKDLGTIIQNVDQATAGLTETQRAQYLNMIFGEQGGRAINALLQTQTEEAKAAGKGWEDYATGVTEGTTAAEMGAAKMDNLGGDLEQLKGGLETLAITATSAFLPMFRSIVQGLDAFVGALTSLPAPLQTAIAGFVGLAGVLGVGAGGFLLMLPRINDTVVAFRALGGMSGILGGVAKAIQGVSTAMRALVLTNPLLLLLAAAVALFFAYQNNWFGFRDGVNAVVDAFMGLSIVQTVVGWITAAASAIADFVGSVVGYYNQLSEGAGPVQAAFQAIALALGDLTGGLDAVQFLADAFYQIGALAGNLGDALGAAFGGDYTAAAASLLAAWENVKYLLTALSGLFTELGKAADDFGETAQKAMDRLAKKFKPISRTLESLGDVFETIGDIAGDVFGAIADVLSGDFGGALDHVMSLTGNLGTLYRQLGVLILNAIGDAVGGLRSGLGAAFDWVASKAGVFGSTVERLGGVIDGLLGFVQNLAQAFADLFSGDWGGFFENIGQALQDLVSGIGDAMLLVPQLILDGFQALFNQLPSGVQSVLSSIGDAISGFVSNVAGTLGTIWDAISGPLGTLGGWIADFAGWAWDAGSAIVGFAASLIDNLGPAWDTIKDGATAVKDFIVTVAAKFADGVTAVGNFYDAVINQVGEIWTNLSGKVSKFRSFIVDVATQFDTAVTAVGNFYDAVINKVGEIWTNLSGKVSKFRSFIVDVATRFDDAVTAVGSFYDAVIEKVGGIWDGVSGGVQSFIDAIQSIVDKLNAIIDTAGRAKDALSGIFMSEKESDQAPLFPGDEGPKPQRPFGQNPLGNMGRPGPSQADIQPPSPAVALGFAALAAAVQATKAAITEFVATTIGVMGGWQGGMTTIVSGAMTPFRATISSGTSTGKQSFLTFVADVIGVMGGWSGGLANIVSGALSAFRSTISSGTSTGKQSFITFVSDTIAVMGGWSGGMKANVASTMSAMVSSVRSGASAMASALRSGANDAANGVASALGRIPGIVAGIGNQAASTAYAIGANISNAFAQGMYSALGAIQSAASAMVSAADTALRAKAAIHSPSRLFMGLGAFVGEGFEAGIRSMIPDVAAATAALVSTPGLSGPTAYAALPALYSAPRGGTSSTVTNVTVYALKSEEWLHMVQTAESAPERAVRAMLNGQAAVPGGR